MNVVQLIALARARLDDTRIPYLWSDDELLTYLVKVTYEWHREVAPIRDSTTPEVTRIYLLSNTHTYSIHPSILKIVVAILDSTGVPLHPITESDLYGFSTSWRKNTGQPYLYIPQYETGSIRIVPYYDAVGYVGGQSVFSGNIVTINTTEDLRNHFSNGDMINISGTALNDGVYTITNVSIDTITVSVSLANESANALLRKVRDTLLLSVDRMMVTPLSLSEPTRSPEIRVENHMDLVDGILREAYLKADTETYDPQRSMRHSVSFETAKDRARSDFLLLRDTNPILKPHMGCL